MEKLLYYLAAIFVVGYSQNLLAEEAGATSKPGAGEWPQFLAPDNLSEEDYIGDVPKVLTVSRLSQSKADSPSAVTVIDRETIRASGIVDLPEIFRLVPGFYVGKNAGFFHNTNHVVSYHGMSNAYAGSMQVLINGRSVYSPLFGGVQWSELPLVISDIDRIEITRGPNAASYGANSFFGVINIITLNPSEQAGASVSATYGNGRHELFSKYAGKLNNLSYRVTAGYRDDDGVDNRVDFKRTRLLNAQADYRLNDKSRLEFEFGIADGNREEGLLNNTQRDPIFLPRTKDIYNHYELIRWQYTLDNDSDFSLQAYHSYDVSDDHVTSINLRPGVRSLVLNRELAKIPPTPLPLATARANAAAAALRSDTVSFSNEVATERYDLEAQHTFAVGKSIRAVWGGSVRQDTMYAPFYLGTSKKDYFNLQRLFGHVEWRALEPFTINTGAMVEHNDFTGTDVSPRASLNFKLNPNHSFRLGASTATRTPNYLEQKFNTKVLIPAAAPFPSLLIRYYSDVGNLNPEKIISKEIGYLGNFGNLNIDARVFDDDIHQVLIAERVNPALPPNTLSVGNPPNSFFNGGDAQVRGFETQVKYRLLENTQIIANYSFINISGSEPTLPSGFASSMPTNSFSALVTHQFDNHWDASYAYYQTGAVEALGDGQPVGLTRRSDIRVARKFNVNRVGGEASIAVENIFDKHYNEFALYNTLGRRALINLNLDF
jgi:iron complex outermembrane recepter protein